MNPESQDTPLTSKFIFEEDVVCLSKRKDKIGLVIQNAINSEDESDSDDEDQISEGHVLVSWYPRGVEEEVEEKMLELVDRSLLPGDVVRRTDVSRGAMKGYVSKVDVTVSIKIVGTNNILKKVNCSELSPLQRFYPGLVVVKDSWIGIVDEALQKVTLKLKNGARCIFEGEQVNTLTDITDQRDEDSPYYCELFYPGQCVTSTNRSFRDVQWINGPRPAILNSQRLSCIVEEVALSGIRVRWQMHGYSGDTNQSSSLAVPDSMVSAEDINRLIPVNNFKEAYIGIGDKASYVLKECDFSSFSAQFGEAVAVSSASASSMTSSANHAASNLPLPNRSRPTKKQHASKSADKPRDELDSCSSDESADDEDSDHRERAAHAVSSSNTAGATRRHDTGGSSNRHQTSGMLLMTSRSHATRRRRHHTRKKKKTNHAMQITPEAGKQVCVEVLATKTKVSVKWQDDSEETDLVSTELLPVEHVDELEFFPGDFIVDKTNSTSSDRRDCYGVVQRVDCVQRTCEVKWLNDEEQDDKKKLASCVSVYDIGDHPDFNFRPGDVVMRLTGVDDSNLSANDEHSSNAKEDMTGDVLPPCGQVVRVNGEGKIEVIWTDRSRSEVKPENLYVVHTPDTDDWSSSANDNTNSDEDWETASDVSSSSEQYHINPLEDIIMRSLAAVSRIGQDQQEHDPSNEIQNESIEAVYQAEFCPHEEQPPNDDNSTTMKRVDVKASSEGGSFDTKVKDSFSMIAQVHDSHRYVADESNPTNPRQFMSTIRKEIIALKSHLPAGVLVKAYESRMDLFSVLIHGPKDTPYEDGLFIFDLQLPDDYPKSPPKVSYLSQCSQRLNPNLYEDGTVCVSLLGTWNGKGTETWTNKSSICQLIISLQGLILCEEPYFNEAGYEKHKGTVEGAENSRLYNEMVIIKLLQCIQNLINHPVDAFKDEIHEFKVKQLSKLLQRVESWMIAFAPDRFSEEKFKEEKESMRKDEFPKPGFPLLPLSYGFCLTLFRAWKSLSSLLD
eukprot:gene9375-10362_t